MTEPGDGGIVRIGAATAFYNDSRMGIAQLFEKGGKFADIIFDFLAESVMGGLGRGLATGTGRGFTADFIMGCVLPHRHVLLDRGVRTGVTRGGGAAGCHRGSA